MKFYIIKNEERKKTNACTYTSAVNAPLKTIEAGANWFEGELAG